MGWQGRVLRVDLTNGVCKEEALNKEWASQYLGSRGLATKYMMESMDPKADPLSPENVIIYATGPLTGTSAPTGGRYTVVTKGALTGAIAASNSGGFFGAELKMAGWDMVIVSGKSPKPVYLMINDLDVQILPADGFIWGDTVWDTEIKVREAHHDPRIRLASIGKSGENLVRYACVINDKDRAAGRSGVGAVMGSKLLKTIAVRGTLGVTSHDPDAFKKAVADTHAMIVPSEGRVEFVEGGTMPMMDVTNSYGSLPTRNNQDVQFEDIDKVNAKAMQTPRKSDGKANLITNKACFACPIGCQRVSKIDPSHYTLEGENKDRYKTPVGGLEYESGFSLAPLVGVSDIEAATYTNVLSNEHGFDPISFGGTVASAMELFENGYITLEDTGGIEFKFGNAKAMTLAAELVGSGEGFGADLGLGAKLLCEKYGHPEFFMGAKGQEFPGYDTRAMQGMGLAYATSNRGGCHMRASPFEDDFTHIRPEGKAQIVIDTQDYASIVDSAGLCLFTDGLLAMPEYAMLVNAACEGDWTEEKMLEAGERIWTIERQFNLAAGLTKEDDTLPDRMLKDAAKSGAGKGRVTELDKMLPEYYQLRGWDKDGVPTEQTLERLGL